MDYGMGNLHSVKKRISKAGGKATISSDPNVISNSEKLVLPGVGHFEKAMRNLKKMNLIKEFMIVGQAIGIKQPNYLALQN